MSNEIKVGLDIDDVLASFYIGMCDWFNKPYNIPLDIWDGADTCKWIVEKHPEINNSEEFWINLEPISLPNDINFKVDCYVTSSPKEMLEVRKNWLNKYGFPDAPVFQRKDKIELLKERNVNIFIDDNLSTVKAVNEANILGLQFKPYYMSKDYEDMNKIITDLNEVGKFLEWNNKVVDTMKGK